MNDEPPSAPQRGTGLAFVQHWDWVAEKGLMPRATALAYRAAASQILKIESGWESIDVREVDVEALFARFRNLSDLSPTSLATYESRFRSGLTSYLSYLENPASYQPRSRKTLQREDRSRLKTKGADVQVEPPGGHGKQPASPAPASGARLVVYPFPVRPDLFAELKLPADLSVDEARRLGRFLEAVALNDAQGSED
ncbi:MAG: hypothetical protein ACLQNU_02575 [Candidatus Dormibacteria bacterium]